VAWVTVRRPPCPLSAWPTTAGRIPPGDEVILDPLRRAHGQPGSAARRDADHGVERTVRRGIAEDDIVVGVRGVVPGQLQVGG
jgi:hypothetical protein